MTPLRRRMLEDMQLRNLSPQTQRNYVHHMKGLARFYQTSPAQFGLEEIREYQLYLLNERRYSADTVNGFCRRRQVPLQPDAGNALARKGTASGPRAASPTSGVERRRSRRVLPPRLHHPLPGCFDDRLWRGIACF